MARKKFGKWLRGDRRKGNEVVPLSGALTEEDRKKPRRLVEEDNRRKHRRKRH